MNEAFIIDTELRNQFVSENSDSEEVLKPILRGRDTRKYYCNFKGLYLINAHNGLRSENIPRIKIEVDFPEIFDYLKSFSPKIQKRSDKGMHWTNLRNCAYMSEIEKDKIVYSEIVSEPQFYFDTKRFYPEASSFLITGENLKWLIAFLNSEAITVMFKIFYAGGELVGKYRYKKSFLENLPIPFPIDTYDKTVTILVDYLTFYKGLYKDKSKESAISNYYELVIDTIVYEILFKSEFQSVNKTILKHLKDLKPINDSMSEEEKLGTIQSEYERLYHPDHPVRFAIETLDSIEEVRIIREALKS
ncbi:TaqI-like C-terminal specificity domain-containing protein [Nonlabens tegetincola]|uniref:TaqI-like C-terminal specificity domain-containing protein n=1 Tax=Nonlabens tegetincola TaxID=323273 RepID=UPI000D48DF90|nr:TaqI-like C-terminal specificity domain-containing protein [Nonlabens tegetincola]PQJ17030.1 hypothetical protein BST93_10175 [Nonlabens tegetincola]